MSGVQIVSFTAPAFHIPLYTSLDSSRKRYFSRHRQLIHPHPLGKSPPICILQSNSAVVELEITFKGTLLSGEYQWLGNLVNRSLLEPITFAADGTEAKGRTVTVRLERPTSSVGFRPLPWVFRGNLALRLYRLNSPSITSGALAQAIAEERVELELYLITEHLPKFYNGGIPLALLRWDEVLLSWMSSTSLTFYAHVVSTLHNSSWLQYQTEGGSMKYTAATAHYKGFWIDLFLSDLVSAISMCRTPFCPQTPPAQRYHEI